MTRRTDGEAELMNDPRPDLRPDPRPDDSRARAEARAAQLMEHGVFDVDTGDKFYVSPGIVPDGWSYEWKRRTVFNQEDPAYQVNLAATGWTPVPLERHPDFMPEGHRGNNIERDGMVLMERPEIITQKFRDKAHRDAMEPVARMEEKLSGTPNGQFERNNKGNKLVKVGRSYESIPIPD